MQDSLFRKGIKEKCANFSFAAAEAIQVSLISEFNTIKSFAVTKENFIIEYSSRKIQESPLQEEIKLFEEVMFQINGFSLLRLINPGQVVFLE